MPTPRSDEARDDFIERCMSDGESKRDFPDTDQRLAFCASRYDSMNKRDFKVGDDVQWQSAGGTARGRIQQIVTEGQVPGIDGDVTVTGTEDDPAAQIRILDDDGNPTDTVVGHKLGTLSRLSKMDRYGPLRAVVDSVMKHVWPLGSSDSLTFAGERGPELFTPRPADLTGTILKADEEQRIVYGWASVVTEKGEPVVDSQGDVIEAADMEKAATEFMQDARVAKAMHEGGQVGEVIHSLPLTKAIGDALGIQADREGWIIAMKIHDDAVWKRIKSGELGAFSIGGRAGVEDIAA